MPERGRERECEREQVLTESFLCQLPPALHENEALAAGGIVCVADVPYAAAPSETN